MKQNNYCPHLDWNLEAISLLSTLYCQVEENKLSFPFSFLLGMCDI